MGRHLCKAGGAVGIFVTSGSAEGQSHGVSHGSEELVSAGAGCAAIGTEELRNQMQAWLLDTLLGKQLSWTLVELSHMT